MVRFSNAELDYFLQEDIPYFDLTTHLLGIEGTDARIAYKTRAKTVVCGAEEAAEIARRCGATVEHVLASGEEVEAGTIIFQASGKVEAIHQMWRVCVNILEYTSGIATRTREFITKARSIAPAINITVTRKIFPGTKKLSIKAALAGGALPHRLGLSETVLIFDEHIQFLGGLSSLPEKIKEIKMFSAEKKVEVEVHTMADAVTCADMGVDILQVDKMKSAELCELVQKVKAINPAIKVAAAGGVTMENIGEYAATGVDIIVTSAMYFGKPADIKAEIKPDVL